MKASLIFDIPSGQSPFLSKAGAANITGRQQARFAEYLLCMVTGQGVRGRLKRRPALKVSTQQANCVVTMASVLAADSVTLNGTAIAAVTGAAVNNQFDRSGTDTATATNLCAAIAASTTSLISDHFRATNKQAIITAATVAVNDTVTIDGTIFYAKTGAVVTDNTGLLVNEFNKAGTNTQCAACLALAINAHPTTSQTVFARGSAATCIVYERAPTIGDSIPISTSSGSTLAITGSVTVLTAGAAVFIESILPGVAGNAATVVTNNGGRLAITFDNSGRLQLGASSTYTY